MTTILMGLLVIAIAASVLYGLRINPDKNEFLSLSDSTFLRGLWCIVVLLVHVPADYQNPIQDAIGSFAYIGVTFFFMTSAFGLKYSIDHKKDYMKGFWLRRLPAILIPALIANAFHVVMKAVAGTEITALSFLNIDGWVKVLLLFYVLFWVVYGLLPKFTRGGYWQDAVMCLLVLACSLIDRFTEFKITFGWIVEPLGFAYGIIAAVYADKIKRWIGEKWLIKSIVLVIVSGVLGIAYLKFKTISVFGDYILKIVLGISITAFVFEAIAKLKVGNAVNRFLGSISYEVYILHRAVFVLIALVVPKANSGIFIFASVLISIGLAYLLNRLTKIILHRGK